MAVPTSTVRLQVRAGFDLYAAADACDVLATLGVGGLYLSPLLPSARGSDHGYDVVGFDTVDADRGGVDGWTRLLAAARARALALVVDIVPNHTGVGDATQNPAWWDVLRHGRGSRYAPWFDIDWATGPLLLPVLGDGASEDELRVDGEELAYYEHRFPVAPGTGPAPGESAADVHRRQHYRLVSFRDADTRQSYRRFFAVTSLAGLRVEDPAVFDATHEQIARWLRADGIAGLRVDHPDGLADPAGYLHRLRELAGPDAWLLVEKVLEPGEQLPAQWPVHGSTGYDAMCELTQVMVDPAAQPHLDALYRDLTGDTRDLGDHIADGKRAAAGTILRAELLRLGRLAPAQRNAAEALGELAVAFDVYRSYLPDGAGSLDHALDVARAERPDLAADLSALAPRLRDPHDELSVRFQQTSGAIMAKGVEDTAFYRYTRFAAANEVGGDPAVLGRPLPDWHAAQAIRQQWLPESMTTLSTHDTKRSEDVRARLFVLAEVADEWSATVRTVMAAAPVPDPSLGYLLWQTFAGAGFIDRDRMHAYAEKAMREAATGTNWIDPDAPFEAAVHAAVDAGYDDAAVHERLRRLLELITPYGWSNALAQKLLQLTMPGVPDVYQGSWTWDDSLVDPDNRRPVDLDALRTALDDLDERLDPPSVDGTGLAKLWVVSRVLRLRRDWPDLFTGYEPVTATGAATEHAVAFDRGGVITVATRLPVRLDRSGGWRDTALPDLGAVTNVLTGRRHQGEIGLAELLAELPVALLVR
jgi:(1->4)-alpha-D-glucan 1-alpha-D-glucosylmutase